MPPSQKSKPPFCQCTVHHCSDYVGGGRTLSRNVFNRHQLDERSASATLLQQAGKVSADALKSQIEDLSAHLAASTLSDQVSGPSNIPGGRLWGTESLTDDCYEPTPHPLPPSPMPSTTRKSSSRRHTPPPRDQAQEVLQHLRDVDEALDILSKEIASDILSAELPSLEMANTVFPFDVHFEALAHLSDQLGMISFKNDEVTTRMKTAKEKLDRSSKRLTDAKDAWLTRIEQLNRAKRLRGGVSFSTGS